MLPMLLLLFLVFQPGGTLNDFRSIRSSAANFNDTIGRTYPRAETPPDNSVDPIGDLVFEAIDYSAGRGLAYGGVNRAAAVAATLLPGEGATSFLAKSIDGNPMLMTVIRRPRPRAGNLSDRYFAVMSRHAGNAAGHATASQLYGTCRGSS